MSGDLYQSVLKDEKEGELKSYNLSRLYLVAFFGGIIPTVALSIKNTLWLRVNKKWIIFMIVSGAVFLLCKAYFVGYYVSAILDHENYSQTKMIRYIFRGATLLLSFIYIQIMNSQYRRLNLIGGELKPILKDAVIWSVIGLVIETIFLFIGGYIGGHVL